MGLRNIMSGSHGTYMTSRQYNIRCNQCTSTTRRLKMSEIGIISCSGWTSSYNQRSLLHSRLSTSQRPLSRFQCRRTDLDEQEDASRCYPSTHGRHCLPPFASVERLNSLLKNSFACKIVSGFTVYNDFVDNVVRASIL